jgi:hypothetical protein
MDCIPGGLACVTDVSRRLRGHLLRMASDAAELRRGKGVRRGHSESLLRLLKWDIARAMVLPRGCKTCDSEMTANVHLRRSFPHRLLTAGLSATNQHTFCVLLGVEKLDGRRLTS